MSDITECHSRSECWTLPIPSRLFTNFEQTKRVLLRYSRTVYIYFKATNSQSSRFSYGVHIRVVRSPRKQTKLVDKVCRGEASSFSEKGALFIKIHSSSLSNFSVFAVFSFRIAHSIPSLRSKLNLIANNVGYYLPALII